MLPFEDECIAPSEFRPVEPAACGKFPFRLSWQLFSDPGRVRRGVLEGHLNNRVICAAVDVAPATFGMTPTRSRDIRPPIRQIMRVDRAGGHVKYQRTRYGQLRLSVGIERRIERSLSESDVPSLSHKPCKFRVGDRPRIDRKAVDLDEMRRPFLSIMCVRPMQNGPPESAIMRSPLQTR